MLERIANRVILLAVFIETGITWIKISGDPHYVGEHHATSWHQVIKTGFRVILIIGKNGECCIAGWLPRKSRRDREALLVVVIYLRVTVEANACQAIQKVAVRIDRTAEIKGTLNTLITSCL